jgi:hypothetical protein
VPLAGARAYRAHGAADVLRGVVEGVFRARLAEQPVLERERRHPEAGKILGRLDAFGVEHQLTMSAPGRHHDRGAVGFAGGRQEHRERGIVDVLVPPVLVLLGFVAARLEAGRAVFPQRNDLLAVGQQRQDESAGGQRGG